MSKQLIAADHEAAFRLAEPYIEMLTACGVDCSQMEPLDVWMQGDVLDSHPLIMKRRRQIKMLRGDESAVLPSVQEAFASLTPSERERIGETISLRLRA